MDWAGDEAHLRGLRPHLVHAWLWEPHQAPASLNGPLIRHEKFHCPSCGTVVHRHENSTANIVHAARRQLTTVAPDRGRPKTLAEQP
ncbi:hypothetical protein P3T37_006077 [Kitasatospora sp. MAA4]|uniref:hypothetical protein n=1 Tax=Kitasatospora sp. MAA4 TaxID=3035093 RepID=UPI002476DCB4|nr:hypothetical protein [Kitasatospora sp. MAA4]MDH6136646.1 hypothetical protein [Kitasatospora sp. MAA4]